jgi:hypothetical protein
VQPSRAAHGEADHLTPSQQTCGLVASSRQPAADLVGERLPELEAPLPPVESLCGSTVADRDTARCQKLIDVAQAQGKAEAESDRVADDLTCEAITGIGRASGRCYRLRLPGPVRPGKPTLAQVDDVSSMLGVTLSGSNPSGRISPRQ